MFWTLDNITLSFGEIHSDASGETWFMSNSPKEWSIFSFEIYLNVFASHLTPLVDVVL